MATPIPLFVVVVVVLLLLSSSSIVAQSDQPVPFIYNGFNQSNLKFVRPTVLKASVLKPSGALRLTDKTQKVIGRAFYPHPIPFHLNTSSSSSNPNKTISSFSTHFVFQIVPSGSSRGGHGLAFTISPAMEFPGAEAGHYLGILNATNNNKSSNHLFAVEFDTVNGFNDEYDGEGNHVGVNINTMSSDVKEMAFYYVDGSDNKEEVTLESGDPIQAWVDYDGSNQVLNVTISPISKPKPIRPLISKDIDLSPVLLENMYVGFSAATGNKSSAHYILGWSFGLNGAAPPLNLSKLPVVPVEKKSSRFKPEIKAILGALSVVVVILVAALLIVMAYRRRLNFENLEEWELDCPHRFKYKDLHVATKGFKESELLGTGGFGAVYKGALPITGEEIAVKKIMSNNSVHGMREFAAEIECLGRLRHKNLVNLQGWCKRKNDLLLVYDYIPNGLVYLHEEWAQVVVHRDVKSSNVLIDGEMNGRLGDFGLARLYDHGTISQTTNVVGTIGYIAPELAQTGKASTSSDVFAYGVLLLEVACGRGPIVDHPERGRVILVDWVIERLQTGGMVDVVDPNLGPGYAVEEMELVLGLGLLCSNPKAEARPSMREILRYLNGDDLLPGIDKLESAICARQVQETMARFFISRDGVTTSSSIGQISSSSFEAGR
ncbi:probable L-type lectin-domain containing receptor kinase VI.1 isoform X2 [Rhododendron vialii]|uniref:probable L-type lectin-domain containing receptor kinase VI.1 isoform X2 n=1 Tax=Rhododendron vialii TaxID=182163 RepID=UPI00265EE845|nr:probable L-type lectin-domain containing receptor kinase VI.1 isoform X2 [Rhododendron vialii]